MRIEAGLSCNAILICSVGCIMSMPPRASVVESAVSQLAVQDGGFSVQGCTNKLGLAEPRARGEDPWTAGYSVCTLQEDVPDHTSGLSTAPTAGQLLQKRRFNVLGLSGLL